MSEFIVSARKYRPAYFNSVVGQSGVTTTLKNAILSKKLAQAYLFCGPRGVGKTTNARIFAKTINCMNLDEKAEACNTCDSCVSFNESRSYNIHELDAASNNAVDDIRSLIEQVRIPPQVGKYSIYIIDEVHMLSQSAFNAFLKTLEEPPSYAVFILATTEKHKILPTILSRCQVFDFNRITIPDIVMQLKHVAQSENIQFDEDGLNIIAQKADGAMRDALSIFDQVVSFTGGNVTYDEVIKNLNVLDYDYYFKITSAFLNSDVRTALLEFDDILSKGFDGQHFINGLSSHFRDLLVCKDPTTVKLLEVGENIKAKYSEQSVACQEFWLFRALEITSKADSGYRTSNNKRLHVEIALMQLSNILNDEKKKSDRLKLQAQKKVESTLQASKQNVVATASKSSVDRINSNLSSKSATVSNTVARPKVVVKASNARSKISTLSIKDALSGNASYSEIAVVENNEVNESQSSYSFNDKVVTEADLLVAWEKMADSYKDDSPRLSITLKSAKPSITKDLCIQFYVNNQGQQDAINTERFNIIESLRNLLSNSKLDLGVLVNELPEDDNMIHTQDDKYKHLITVNPKLLELKKALMLEY